MEEFISKFVLKQNKLLLLEREENLSNILKDLSPAFIHNLEKSGQALTKLKVSNVAHSGSEEYLIDFELSNNIGLENNLSQGDLVVCIPKNKKNNSIRGIIISVSDTALTISSNNFCNIEVEEENIFSILKTDSDFTYKCQSSALNNLEKKEIYSSRCLDIIKILFNQDKNVVNSLLITEYPVPENLLNENKLINFENNSLANDQKIAVEFALKRKYLAILQGPPGTGKTTTLVELVVQLHRLGKKVLLCAPTNVAVDNIAVKLGETEAKPLRLGHYTRVMKSALKYTLDYYVQRDDCYKILEDIKHNLKVLETTVNNERERNYKEINNLRKEYKRRLRKLHKDILMKCTVILSTLNSASRRGYLQYLEKDYFDVLIVDEASQALEASMWIAIPNAPKLVIAGDINQLPPTVMCQEAVNQGLSISLMERAIKKLGKKSFISLTRQYRMNEKIMLWSSKRFYQDSLQADDTVKHHLLKDLPEIKQNSLTCESLVFIDTCGCECEEYQSAKQIGSKGNIREAVIVNKIVFSLIQSGLSEKCIGIITPYSLQVDLIRKSLICDSLDVEINTVDGFQGREKEVIILSLVRSNLEKELGFLTDFRRLNVAVTRARRLLVVIGNSETVEKNDTLVSLLSHIEENGLLETAEEYLSVYDDIQLKIEKAVETNTKSKPKVFFLDKTEGRKVTENIKIKTEVKSEAKLVNKLNDKGIALSSCQNRKEYNIFDTIASNEVDETVSDDVEKDDKLEFLQDFKLKEKTIRTKAKSEMKHDKNNEDFDKIVEEFTKANYICALENCKSSTQVIYSNCQFCKKRFCLKHGMQEIHGCGEAIRRKERKEFRHKMPEPAKKKDKDRFSQKLKQLEEARKPKSTKENSKKSKKK